MKTCTRCKVEQPLENFHAARGAKANKDGKHARCKKCVYESRNIARLSAYHREWKYGLTEQSYVELLDKQNNSCAICKRADVRLVVDHCHVTERVRGLLCDRCNTGIGQLGDSVEMLKTAIAYLETT